MWDVILHILSLTGIILLVLLGLLLAALLLTLLVTLFYPVFYRVHGWRRQGETRLEARVDWLLGLLRLRYSYPEPGTVTVKFLWMTLFDSGQKKEASAEPDSESEKTGKGAAQSGRESSPKASKAEEEDARDKGQTGVRSDAQDEGQTGVRSGARGESHTEMRSGARDESHTEMRSGARDEGHTEMRSGQDTDAGHALERSGTVPEEIPPGQAQEAGEGDGSKTAENSAGEPESGILGKISKIKYTIQKTCDKIKETWERISRCVELPQEEDTRALWRHVTLRLGKILKSVRPRQFRAELLFGTGAPDTTGYLFGVYGMLYPSLGDRVCVTPDFTRPVFEGEAKLSGRITGFVLLWNALWLLLDKRLQRFIKKIKRAGAQAKKPG